MPQDLFVCLSCDVEGNPDTWSKELEKLVHVVNKNEAKITFFVALDEGETHLFKYSRTAQMLHSFEQQGHEIGLHIHWGSWKIAEEIRKDFHKRIRICPSYLNSLESIGTEAIEAELQYYVELMHRLGFSPTSFRGGGLCQTTDCLKILAKHGFEVDSSVAPGLNEKGAWHQNHIHVSYDRSYYYPSKTRYDLPAKNEEERIGILEVPVTRQRTSSGSWSSILTAKSFMQVYNWAVLHQKINPKVVTLICHNWEIERASYSLLTQSLKNLRLHFSFVSAFKHVLTMLKREGVKFVTMKELQEELRLYNQT
jgi:hypothetical protein